MIIIIIIILFLGTVVMDVKVNNDKKYEFTLNVYMCCILLLF